MSSCFLKQKDVDIFRNSKNQGELLMVFLSTRVKGVFSKNLANWFSCLIQRQNEYEEGL